MGIDPGSVNTTLGVDDGGGFDADRTDPYFNKYVPLNTDQMAKSEEFYDAMEPLIDSANNIKSHHNLGGRFRVIFAGSEELDDAKYHHIKPIGELLEQARREKDKFGFVLVQDTNAHLDNQVRRIVDAPLRDDDDDDEASAVSTMDLDSQRRSDLFGREGNADTADLDAAQRRSELASLHIHRAAGAVGASDPRATLLGPAPVDDPLFGGREEVETQRQPVNPARGVRETMVVRREARSSTLEAPNATARVVREGGDEDDRGQRREERQRVRTERRSRTADELFSSLRDIRIVKWQDGRLFLQIDKLTGKRSVVFCRCDDTCDESGDEYRQSVEQKKLPRSMRIDPSVKVFVWPNRLPDDNGNINTRTLELIFLRQQLMAADERLQMADEASVRPTVFLGYNEKVTPETYRDMTEQEMFSGAGDRSAQRRNAERQQTIREYELGVIASIQNGRARSELNMAIARGRKKLSVEGGDGSKQYTEKGPERVFELPRGYTVSQVVSGTTLDDVQQRRAVYENRVASTMGIPLSLLEGGGGAGNRTGGGASSGNVTSSAAALVGDLFRSTILKDREDLALFFHEIYDVLYRSIDNRAFARMLASARTNARRNVASREATIANLRRRFDLVTEAAEQVRIEKAINDSEAYVTSLIAHYADIENEVRAITSLEYRLSIEFDKFLFVTFDELEQARATHAISGFEYANIVRTKMAMEPLTEAEYKQNQAEQLEKMRSEMLATLPPPTEGPGGGGGGGGSSSSSTATKKRSSESAASESSTGGAAKKARSSAANQSSTAK